MLQVPCVVGWLGTQGLVAFVQPTCLLHSSPRIQQLALGIEDLTTSEGVAAAPRELHT